MKLKTRPDEFLTCKPRGHYMYYNRAQPRSPATPARRSLAGVGRLTLSSPPAAPDFSRSVSAPDEAPASSVTPSRRQFAESSA